MVVVLVLEAETILEHMKVYSLASLGKTIVSIDLSTNLSFYIVTIYGRKSEVLLWMEREEME